MCSGRARNSVHGLVSALTCLDDRWHDGTAVQNARDPANYSSHSREAHLDQALLGQARARKEGLGLSAGQPPIAVPVSLHKPGVHSCGVRHAARCALVVLRGACCWWPRHSPARSCWGSRGPCSRLARRLAALGTGAQMRWQGRQRARRSAPGWRPCAWRGRTGARTPDPGTWRHPGLRSTSVASSQMAVGRGPVQCECRLGRHRSAGLQRARAFRSCSQRRACLSCSRTAPAVSKLCGQEVLRAGHPFQSRHSGRLRMEPGPACM